MASRSRRERLEHLQALSVDIDTRLMELWMLVTGEGSHIAMAMSADEELADELGIALRSAYGKGYCDSVTEVADGRKGELYKAHGYQVPSSTRRAR